MVILILLAATEATYLVTTFTRFSEEVFTAVVSIFFVAEAIYYIVQVSAFFCYYMYLYYILDLQTKSIKVEPFRE